MRTAWRGPEGGKRSPFGEQESVGSDAQRGVMMKATPTSPLVVAKPEFLFEVLVVPLDPPPQLCGVHQGAQADACGQGGQKVLCRLGFVRRPFDQAPFLGARRGTVVIAMRGADTDRGEARRAWCWSLRAR